MTMAAGIRQALGRHQDSIRPTLEIPSMTGNMVTLCHGFMPTIVPGTMPFQHCPRPWQHREGIGLTGRDGMKVPKGGGSSKAKMPRVRP